MNQSNVLKFIAGAGLYGMWFALVIMKIADPMPFIASIGGGIAALFGYHAITTLQPVPAAVAAVASVASAAVSASTQPAQSAT